MADKGSKVLTEIVKALEIRILKIEKELKSQQDLIKKLVLCISDLTHIVKSLPAKEIKKSMAFKYPLITQETKLDLSTLEDSITRILTADEKIDQFSELSLSDNDDFSLSMDTLDIIESL